MLKTSLIRKTPAYPPKRTSKKRIIATDADAKFNLKVISAIESCFKGCLAGRVSLASFEHPRQRPSARGKWEVSPFLLDGDPIGYCTKQILSRRQNGPQVLHAPWARSDTSLLAKVKGTAGRTGTPSLDCAWVFHLCHRLLYLQRGTWGFAVLMSFWCGE